MIGRALVRSAMGEEIAEQMCTLWRIVERRRTIAGTVQRVAPNPLRGIVLTGRGTSYHAAEFGRMLLELSTGRPASLYAPSMRTVYGARTDYSGYLAIGLSQSGRTAVIADTLAGLSADGARTVALTAHPDAWGEPAPDARIDIGSGTEHAVPATKSFTAELAVLALIARALGDPPFGFADLEAMVAASGWTIADDARAFEVAKRLDDVTQLSVIGEGLLGPIAHEGALKLAETAGIAATGYAAGSFRHGPIALADARHPIIAIESPSAAGSEVARIVGDLRAEHLPVLTLGPGDTDLPIAAELPDALLAIAVAIRVQQLALACAIRRNLDPDRPRRLEKVTAS